MSMITAADSLPPTIASDKEQIGTHAGDTYVSAKLTIKGIIEGGITIAESGEVIIEGQVIGNIDNSGKLTIEKGGNLEGNLDTRGEYTLHGEHNGEKMNLLSGSFTHLTGKGIIDLSSEKGAQLQVDESAEIHNRNGNEGDAIINDGSIMIGGGSVAKSLTSTGKVVFTGSGVFS